MADHGYEYEEIDETAPRRRLAAHTPAVEDSFSWITADGDEESE
ncbi:hypothetical protein [Amycolatopsis sp. MtRt-6]|nr:hypothetical protein [Amycolatopsis sp. MtRt-6]